MRWNNDLGKQPKDIADFTFNNLKSIVKKQLQSKMNHTTPLKPTNFVARSNHKYPDESVEALLLLGLWKGGFRTWALRQIAKEKDAIVGETYVNGKTAEGKTIIVFHIQKGKGKGKIDKIEKKLYTLLPKTKFEMQFVLSSEMKKEIAKEQKVVEKNPAKKLAQMTNELQETIKLFNRKIKNNKATATQALQKQFEAWLGLHGSLKEEVKPKFKKWASLFQKQYDKMKLFKNNLN